ncbi:MAG: hypothetical protein JNL54_07690 [Kineosporiaceae bacterium]|nr:hypothetical protein [Kineosporiaceae bacterium]
MRNESRRLADRFGGAVDTEPIDLRDIRRAAPPRAEVVHQRLGPGRRRVAPIPPATVTVFGAPIPGADVADPEPGAQIMLRRTPWGTPLRRRQLRLAGVILAGISAVALVVTAAASVFGGS